MRPKKIPMRMCTGCGEMKPKKELVRVVKAPSNGEQEGEISQNTKIRMEVPGGGKKPGRGAYVCRNVECLKLARKARRLEKAFSCRIPDEVYEKLEGEMSGNE